MRRVRGRFPNKTGCNERAADGNIVAVNPAFGQPRSSCLAGYAASMPTFNGKPLLLRNPLANSDSVGSVRRWLDVRSTTKPASPRIISSWTQPFVEGDREYLIQSLFDQDDLEFWRTFLDDC
jgi:hypothetical protein